VYAGCIVHGRLLLRLLAAAGLALPTACGEASEGSGGSCGPRERTVACSPRKDAWCSSARETYSPEAASASGITSTPLLCDQYEEPFVIYPDASPTDEQGVPAGCPVGLIASAGDACCRTVEPPACLGGRPFGSIAPLRRAPDWG
jgi:hypothetical protein